MSIDFFEVTSGDALPPFAVHIDEDDVRAYLAATGEADGPSAELWRERVPPLAVGAFAFSALMELMPLPPGTLHAGQEFEFVRSVPAGGELTATVTVERRAERRGSLLTTLLLELRVGDEPVATGHTTLVTPVEGASR